MSSLITYPLSFVGSIMSSAISTAAGLRVITDSVSAYLPTQTAICTKKIESLASRFFSPLFFSIDSKLNKTGFWASPVSEETLSSIEEGAYNWGNFGLGNKQLKVLNDFRPELPFIGFLECPYIFSVLLARKLHSSLSGGCNTATIEQLATSIKTFAEEAKLCTEPHLLGTIKQQAEDLIKKNQVSEKKSVTNGQLLSQFGNPALALCNFGLRYYAVSSLIETFTPTVISNSTPVSLIKVICILWYTNRLLPYERGKLLTSSLSEPKHSDKIKAAIVEKAVAISKKGKESKEMQSFIEKLNKFSFSPFAQIKDPTNDISHVNGNLLFWLFDLAVNWVHPGNQEAKAEKPSEDKGNAPKDPKLHPKAKEPVPLSDNNNAVAAVKEVKDPAEEMVFKNARDAVDQSRALLKERGEKPAETNIKALERFHELNARAKAAGVAFYELKDKLPPDSKKDMGHKFALQIESTVEYFKLCKCDDLIPPYLDKMQKALDDKPIDKWTNKEEPQGMIDSLRPRLEDEGTASDDAKLNDVD